MIRQHQFSKVELVSLVLPQNSKDELDRMTNAAETVLQRLELPYKTMLLCSQDIGFCAQKPTILKFGCRMKRDIEKSQVALIAENFRQEE